MLSRRNGKEKRSGKTGASGRNMLVSAMVTVCVFTVMVTELFFVHERVCASTVSTASRAGHTNTENDFKETSGRTESREVETRISSNVSVSAFTDRTEMFMNEKLHYTVRVRYESDTMDAPVLEPPVMPGFDTDDMDTRPIIEDGKKAGFERIYTLSPVQEGTLIIEPARIRYRVPGTEGEMIAQTPAITVRVKKVPLTAETEEDIRGPRPPVYYAGKTERSWLKWLVVLAGLTVLYFLLRPKKIAEEPVLAAVQIKEDPYAVALRELAELEKSDYLSDPENTVIRITAITRKYIEEVCEIKALEMTTSEIVASLAGFEISMTALADMESFLDDADLVKFARSRMNEIELKECFTRARKFLADFEKIRPGIEKILQERKIKELEREKKLRAEEEGKRLHRGTHSIWDMEVDYAEMPEEQGGVRR